jgi:imipenem/basic amino acid-specific outer membrane pore
MKHAKISLIAALLLGSSAYAFENTEVTGNANFFYSTFDGHDATLFGKDTSTADASIGLGVTTDINDNVKAGVTGYVVSTFGLQYQVAANAWSGAHYNMDTGEIQYPSSAWVGEAWLEATFGKTVAKAGRMAIDTPLVFTETWGIAPNTFEGATLTNTDLPETTITAAWIDSGNGYSQFLLTDTNGKFSPLGNQGALALGVSNNSWKPLTLEGWYYNLPMYSQAYWLEGDFSMDGIVAGVQYTGMNPDQNLSTAKDSTALAVKLGYEGIENLGIYASYSTTDKDGDQYIGNIATRPGEGWGMQTKLYTEAWWNFGYVGLPGTDSYNVTATYNIPEIADLGLFYTNIDVDNPIDGKNTLDEITFTAGKSFGKLDTLFAYIYTDTSGTGAVGQNQNDGYSTVQFYLTYNFQ